MYSPRRRYHRYQSKKYYRNNLFAPTLHKANMPTYYQMKGRILQQTPSRIKNAPTEMLSRPKLDEMYETLVKAKYPIPIPPVPSEDFVDFEYNFKTDFISMANWPSVIDLQYLNTFVAAQLPNLPEPPEGYSYGFQLTFIDFTYKNNNTTDTDRFSFSWDSSLSASVQSLISKSQNTTGSLDFNGEVYASLAGPQFMRYSQVAFTTTSIQYRFTSFLTSDIVQGEDLYPLITTLQNMPTYNASINIQIDSGPTNTNSSFALGIKMFFVNDSL